MSCTITQNLDIAAGTQEDYESLSHYHYRENRLGPWAAIYTLKGRYHTAERLNAIGVIVYTMPATGAAMRNVATGGIFAGLDRSTRLALINKNIRTISRVIIEPRFRSLGLGARLVRETMPLMGIAFIEALAVMGQVNPFFEKAGMTRFDPPVSADCVRFIEALDAIGIDERDLIDPGLIQQKLDKLRTEDRGQMTDFVEQEMTLFLQRYGRRRLMQPGIERTRFVLSKLTDRPVYYIWQNPNIELRI
jgi:hypothetical protein